MWQFKLLCFALISLFLISPAGAQVACDQTLLKQAENSYGLGDYAKALDLLSPLARNGCTTAPFYLAVMYDQGKGMAQDYAQAAQWAHKVAEQGDPDAQFMLGGYYLSGEKGVPQDMERSVDYVIMAAQQGHAAAQSLLDEIFPERAHDTCAWMKPAMDAFQQKDYPKALKTLQPMAERGCADAQTLLGKMYDDGLGVTPEKALSAEWYRKAAEQGEVNAQRQLGHAYLKGEGVLQDEVQAAAWYLKAAEQGDSQSQTLLGTMYYAGRGVTEDYVQAASWLQKAAAQGETRAQELLDEMTAKGTVGEVEIQRGYSTSAPVQQTEFAYHVVEQGQAAGPFSSQHIRQRIREGRLKGNDLVWREGLAEWTKARDVPELHASFASGAAPVPAATTREGTSVQAVVGTYRIDPKGTEEAAFQRYLREYGESERAQARADARADADLLLEITLSADGVAVMQVGSGAYHEVSRGRWDLSGGLLKIEIDSPNPERLTGTLGQGMIHLKGEYVEWVLRR